MSARGALRLAVLISGRGSNMAAIARACAAGAIDAQVVLVIADAAAAGGLALAERLQLATTVIPAQQHQDRERYEAALAAAIDGCGAELIVLAGFMRILSASFVQRYAGRLLNIHPSLLPRHKGLHTHRRVLEARETEHGASVHFVTAQLDGGPVICQARVPVLDGDSEQTLAARVLAAEHRIYPKVIGLMAAGRLRLAGDRILLDGRPLTAPLTNGETAAAAHHVPAPIHR